MRINFSLFLVLLGCQALMSQNNGIGAWQFETTPPGKKYLFYSKVSNGEWDTIPWNKFIDSLSYYFPGGGGGGGITSLNGLTAGTQSFAVGSTGTDVNIASSSSTHTFHFPTASATNRGVLSTTDWINFNSKYTPSGGVGYVPFFSTSTTLTNQHDFLVNNAGGAFKLGVGFVSGGNSQLANYMEANASGLVVQDDAKAGIGFSTSTSNRWTIYTNTSNEIVFNRWGGAAWPASPWLKLGSTGMLTGVDATFSGLSGSGTRMVVADATGLLSTQTIPSAGVTNLSWSGISATSATLNSSTGTDVTVNAGTGVTFSGTTSLTINAASSGSSGLTAYGGLSNIGALTVASYGSGTAGGTCQINYTTGVGTVTYTSGTGEWIVPSTGNYEITFDHNVSSNSTTGTTLWSGIYVNGAYYSGTNAFSSSVYAQNTVYSHNGSFIAPLTSGQIITIRVKLEGATAAYNALVSGAKFTIKKLN